MSVDEATTPDGGPPAVTNPAGQRSLRWRAAPHGQALARMRAYLADPAQPLPIRSIAHDATTDPAIALLDSWGVVTDIVSFYTERIAQEGFLRTATERDSVRQLARTLGYELRPGVSAEVELVVEVETAAGAPEAVQVPEGTPVQTIPAPGELPQIFETSEPLEARGAWNALSGAVSVPQEIPYGTDTLWLAGTTTGVRVDDHILVVGSERRGVTSTEEHSADHEKWDVRRVVEVTTDPEYAVGWTRLQLDRGVGFTSARPLVAEDELVVHHLTRRLNLFGWTSPAPELLDDDHAGQWDDWDIDAAERVLEIDGDVPELAVGGWLVLDQPGRTESYQITSVTPSGAAKFGIAGKVTRVGVDVTHHLDDFDRHEAIVLGVSRLLPALRRPDLELVGAAHDGTPGTTLAVTSTEPAFEADRWVLVEGITEDGTRQVEATTVTAVSTAAAGPAHAPGVLELTVDPPLRHRYHPGSVTVRGNVVLATHGETVAQALGSGDGRVEFPTVTLRRAPLTHVRSTTDPTGATPELTVRVEGVAWSPVESLLEAGRSDQAYTSRQAEDGSTSVTFGNGTHGARLPTGVENVTATYRVGIGEDGAADAGQVSLPMRKPRGIKAISNLLPTRDWAPPEGLDEARTNAPQRIRTLDRVVSVEDYADFARGYSGVGRARADLVWTGQVEAVVLTVLDATLAPASTSLVADLRDTIDAAREERAVRVVLPGDVIDIGATLSIEVDPRHEEETVLADVRAALLAAHGGLDLAQPLAASALLVVAAETAGVTTVTMPTLTMPSQPGADPDLLVAAPARWAGVGPGAGGLVAAQALALRDHLLAVAVDR
ncbi:hypothetical protein AVL62_13535 [Serinicoccus chungangensis]|uniref:Baseplate protein J-like domain-containing protein n=1 Tax=Serinicoccus chungangensis TaxID=767452 RepID=A0A0W8IBW5_9MICO|nr:hypothetical protein [Serinicoccus chungangensis]KUG57441.1 hypothetical protein AVL62_13535 [Serinicoccus chungangensis]